MMFAELFRLNYGRLVAYAKRLLRGARIPECEHAPEDAVQSGFLMLLDDVAKGKLKSVNGFLPAFRADKLRDSPQDV